MVNPNSFCVGQLRYIQLVFKKGGSHDVASYCEERLISLTVNSFRRYCMDP